MAKEKILLVIADGVVKNVFCTTQDIDICIVDHDNIRSAFRSSHPDQAPTKAQAEITLAKIETFSGNWAEIISPEDNIEVAIKDRLTELDMLFPHLTPATFVSVWDGSAQVHTSCLYDLASNIVSNIETADVDDNLFECEREFVLLKDGTEIVTFYNADYNQNYVNGEPVEEEVYEIN